MNVSVTKYHYFIVVVALVLGQEAVGVTIFLPAKEKIKTQVRVNTICRGKNGLFNEKEGLVGGAVYISPEISDFEGERSIRLLLPISEALVTLDVVKENGEIKTLKRVFDRTDREFSFDYNLLESTDVDLQTCENERREQIKEVCKDPSKKEICEKAKKEKPEFYCLEKSRAILQKNKKKGK